MTASGIKTTSRVRTTDGRMGVVVALGGEVAEVMFPEGEEWINLTDLVPARLNPIDELFEHCSTSFVENDERSDDGHSGRWNNASEFGLCQQANFLRHVLRFDPLAGLTNARIEPKPHQVSIVRSIIQKRQDARRVQRFVA
jgi:hypothetical protein